MACATNVVERRKYAKKMGISEKIVMANAMGFMKAMKARKDFVMSHPKKIEIARKILDSRKDRKCITFSATIKDAEKFADEDRKVKEAVDTKNEAEALLYQSESTLNEMGDKVDAADKAQIDAEAEKLREAIKTNDTETIKAATEAFKKAFYAVAEKIYKANAPQGDMGGAQGGAGFQNDDGSFNADFTEK
jgi:molecular chaperone DnaK (HSP70)